MNSVALVDQTRALDASRVFRYLGTLAPEDYAPVRAAVRLIFDL